MPGSLRVGEKRTGQVYLHVCRFHGFPPSHKLYPEIAHQSTPRGLAGITAKAHFGLLFPEVAKNSLLRNNAVSARKGAPKEKP
jgi:hypothetical protein